MCGIVGYIGDGNAQDVLLGGLRRLEYRGYDSAGIVTAEGDDYALLRAKGKVAELEAKVASSRKDHHIGIGHTRWATHGVPAENNAHPHKAGDILLVHNGIIENHKELRKELGDYVFRSETDTEVLAALIDLFYEDNTALVDAVSQALKLVEGTYGIAVLSTRNSKELVVARSGSPLVVGVGRNDTVIASDASALIGYTDRAIYLNDGEIAVCTAGNVDLRDLESQPITPKLEAIETDIQAIQKGGYEHFLKKEIFEQPDTLRSTLGGRVVQSEQRVQLGGIHMTSEELRNIEHVMIVGCGTALYAGSLAAYYIERLMETVTVSVAIASELRYRSFATPRGTVALIVSQSGETADTLACLKELKRRGVPTLGIVNAVGSTIAREVDSGVYIHAGPEISVASTKAFTSQAVAMIMFGILLAQAQGASTHMLAEYIDELAILPDELERILPIVDEQSAFAAKKYSAYDHALFLGRDTAYPVALEGALKLKEVSYIHAEGYAMGELKHGPIALIDDKFFEVALVCDDWLIEKSMSGLSEIHARGGHILAITDSKADLGAETTIRLDTKIKLLSPILINIVQQLFAYYMAIEKGNDVDQPRNLAKSVTVE